MSKAVARYRIVTRLDDNATFMVTCPAFPEVTTYGETTQEILANATAAIAEAIAARISAGEPVPRPDA
jgi:antitoxin HicB